MASEVKHTPLPWKISRYGIGFEIEGVVDGEPHVIAQTQQLRGTDRDEGHWERKANTEFIVTAVNNYATLERQLSDLRAALEGKWISVKERLPERRIRVLAWDGTLVKDCFYGKPSSVTRKHLSCAWRRTSDESLWSFVTHWQPLPPAPKEA